MALDLKDFVGPDDVDNCRFSGVIIAVRLFPKLRFAITALYPLWDLG